MLNRIDTKANTTQALCVTPTRELAIQIVQKAILPMSVNMQQPKLRVQLAIAQCDPPSRNDYLPHIVVGTPGKIVDWMKRRILIPNNIKVFVLDEADTMVEAGSGHRANSLLIQQKLSYECQCLFFSATFSSQVLQFSTKIMNNNNAVDKILIEDGPEYLVLDIIKQLYVDTRNYRGGKLEFLADIYSLLTIGQSIVFVGRKDDADAIYNTLHQAGYTCSLLHGSVEPSTRDEVMEAFRNGESNVLITTNVLARGVDVRIKRSYYSIFLL
jgi:ATP-dependent RNA helicase DDX19/DBP5